MSNNRDIPSTKKKHVHRRMVSLPSFETILAKSKLLLSTSPPEISPIPESPSEESNHVKLISSTSIPFDTQRCNSSPSNLTDTNNNTETFPSSDSANSTLFVVTSPSFNSDLSSEQNDDVNQLDSSSVSYLQSKQRRIDHRRNRSEPVKSQSTEDLSSNSVINNDSSNNNTPTEIRKKSTAATTPSSSSSSRKKKAWYNVSRNYHSESI
ncbi:unnamed protein product [Adineta ricciae]|uniref:Uncharacterized protein n=1 Tax=Adineta ricciae TaxID=249248 RepID=A0A816DTQ4_ADIRI|nr:unnamed protein product [Adineta ricciae]